MRAGVVDVEKVLQCNTPQLPKGGVKIFSLTLWGYFFAVIARNEAICVAKISKVAI
jgi:hypothetical protein